MSLSPSLLRTLETDMARGTWGGPTQRFWETLLMASSTVTASPTIMRVLAQECASGRWTATTRRVFAAILPASTPSTLATLRQDFSTGQWSPATVQAMERV